VLEAMERGTTFLRRIPILVHVTDSNCHGSDKKL